MPQQIHLWKRIGRGTLFYYKEEEVVDEDPPLLCLASIQEGPGIC
jgi:hypothetical protein